MNRRVFDESSPERHLVRDNTIVAMAEVGAEPMYYETVSVFEHREYLIEKIRRDYNLLEEVVGDEDAVETLADLSEVLHSFTRLEDYEESHLKQTRHKRLQAGLYDEPNPDSLGDKVHKLAGALESTPSTSDRLERLADLLQCVYVLAGFKGIRPDIVETMRVRRKTERGSYIGGVILVDAIEHQQ